MKPKVLRVVLYPLKFTLKNIFKITLIKTLVK